MNRYRVQFRASNRCTHFNVEASTHGVAIKRALARLDLRADSITVVSTLKARNIVRDRIEKQSHGRALAVDAR